LGIRSGYLCLYEMPMKSVGIEELPTWSRLILAVTDQKRLELESGGRRFLSQQLLQAGILPSERRYDMLVMPLYFQEHQLGFVLFEVGPRDGRVYEALQGQLSSALQGAILLEARKRVEEELKQHRDRLEEIIKQRTNELIAVNEELQQEIADRTQVEKALTEERNLLRTLLEREIAERKQAEETLNSL
jgi:hypothetical protein